MVHAAALLNKTSALNHKSLDVLNKVKTWVYLRLCFATPWCTCVDLR